MDSEDTKEASDSIKEGVRINKKAKAVPVSKLTREELEARLLQLEAHNKQLQNLLAKSQGVENGQLQSSKKSKKKRPFDFTKHSKRHILLKFAYLGWDYSGFAVQEDTQQTIEAQLFSALLKTRLIASRETSNYHRCGRTDKGVSAFDQVISITLRSRLSSGLGLIKSKSCESETSKENDSAEIDYVSLLNKVLPPEIRMLAWCPVAEGFSARFDCSHRKYKYFFPRGNLDIKLMNEAAQHLIGYHDYRNFCKMDVGNGVVNFCRHIQAIEICEVSSDVEKNKINPSDMNVTFKQQPQEKKLSASDIENMDNDKMKDCCKRTRDTVHLSENRVGLGSEDYTYSYNMCVATIEGQAFLWHQVRAIMAVLFLIGEGKEEPTIIQELLNVEKHPRKPQYCLASDIPLNLYKTAFPGIVWHYNKDSLTSVISQLQSLWTQHSVRSVMIRRMLWDLETLYQNQQDSNTTDKKMVIKVPQDQTEWLVPGAKTKVYRPLLTRPTCESLETRVEHYVKRRRLEPNILQKISGKAEME